MSGQVKISCIMVRKMHTLVLKVYMQPQPSHNESVQTLFKLRIKYSNNMIKAPNSSETDFKNVSDRSWLAFTLQRLSATRGFSPLICEFSTSQFLWCSYYLLCSAVNPTIPSAILPLNPHKEWIGIARCCSLHTNGRVRFKRNYISYCSGSVDIFYVITLFTLTGSIFMVSPEAPQAGHVYFSLYVNICVNISSLYYPSISQ